MEQPAPDHIRLPTPLPLSTLIATPGAGGRSLFFSRAAWEGVERITRPFGGLVPGGCLLEFEMDALPAAKVDVSIALSACDATRAGLANMEFPERGIWSVLRDFCLAWFDQPAPADVFRLAGLECDAPEGDGEAAVPGLWVRTTRESLGILIETMRALLGESLVPAHEYTVLAEFIRGLPGEVAVPFVGLVLGRGDKELRAELEFTDAAPGLRLLPLLAAGMPAAEIGVIRDIIARQFPGAPSGSVYRFQIRSGRPPVLTGAAFTMAAPGPRPTGLVALLRALPETVAFDRAWIDLLPAWRQENEDTKRSVSHVKIRYAKNRGLYLKAYLQIVNKHCLPAHPSGGVNRDPFFS